MKCNTCGWENSTKSYGIDKNGHWICSDCKMTELIAEEQKQFTSLPNRYDFNKLPPEAKAIINPEWEAATKCLVVGYQQCGPDMIIAIVDKTAKATPEEVEASWKAFEEKRKNYDPYKQIHVGPAPITPDEMSNSDNKAWT